MKAEKGDLIRIVKEKRFNSDDTEDFLLGAIYEVDHVDADGYIIFYDSLSNLRYISNHSWYVIHRKAGEEDEAVDCDMCSGDPERVDCPYCATEEKAQDVVNSPNHYTQGRFETIEIIEEITKGYEDGYVAYCVGNALKYLARAPFKHGEPTEDLAKAERYLAFANEYLTQSTE